MSQYEERAIADLMRLLTKGRKLSKNPKKLDSIYNRIKRELINTLDSIKDYPEEELTPKMITKGDAKPSLAALKTLARILKTPGMLERLQAADSASETDSWEMIYKSHFQVRELIQKLEEFKPLLETALDIDAPKKHFANTREAIASAYLLALFRKVNKGTEIFSEGSNGPSRATEFTLEALDLLGIQSTARRLSNLVKHLPFLDQPDR